MLCYIYSFQIKKYISFLSQVFINFCSLLLKIIFLISKISHLSALISPLLTLLNRLIIILLEWDKMLILDDLAQQKAIANKEENTSNPELQKHIIALAFKIMSTNIPENYAQKPKETNDSKSASFLGVKFISMENEWDEGEEPDKVLSGTDLVEHDKDEGLDEATQGNISEELHSRQNKQNELRDESQN